VVLETIAAVPGMVGGTLQHLRALRRMESDHGWIHTLLDEAENERMHLMTFIHIARPTRLERVLVVLAQGAFFNFFFLLYLISPKTAHRVAGYLEEEAVQSYTEYLARVDSGPAPTSPRPGSPSITGSSRPTPAYATSSWPSAQTRPVTATSTTHLRTRCRLPETGSGSQRSAYNEPSPRARPPAERATGFDQYLTFILDSSSLVTPGMSPFLSQRLWVHASSPTHALKSSKFFFRSSSVAPRY
jgi:hypothetical protein